MSLNIGFITWIIKKDDFRRFHNAKIGESMLSEEVTTQDMQWYMKCFPNGSKHKFEGWVGLSLNLKRTSIASHVTNVLVRYYLYESQSSSISRGIARFNNHPQLARKMTTGSNIDDGTSNNKKGGKNAAPNLGYAKSNGTNYLVELDVLKKYDIIILKCEFEIIRMYQFNKIVYGYPLRLNKIISYEWNISNKYLEKFKATSNPYTRLYSSEFNIWNLVLVPSATTYNSKGNISLRLRLYELPAKIQSIRVMVVLSCRQFNKRFSTVCDLSYGQPWIAWPADTLKKSVVNEQLFDEQTNNTQHSLKVLSFQCQIEILSIQLDKLNNVPNLVINDNDSKYRNVWSKFIMDDNNVFMKPTATTRGQNDADDAKTSLHDEMNPYDITESDICVDDEVDGQYETNDEYAICKKEDFIRMNILKSLNLTDSAQKEYLMNTVYAMNENIRILRKEKEANTKMLKQLQTMMHSMQKNMKSMKQQIEHFAKKKSKDEDDDNFIKRMKKEKSKRDRADNDDVDKKEKKKKKKKKKDRQSSSSMDISAEKEKKDSNDINEDDKKEKLNVSASASEQAPKKSKKLTAKQQLFKTWMDMVVHLPQYFQLFLEAGYEDLSYLENMQLTEQDLIQIGIEKPGHRLKILQEIKKLKPENNPIMMMSTTNNNSSGNQNHIEDALKHDDDGGMDGNNNNVQNAELLSQTASTGVAVASSGGDDLFLDINADFHADHQIHHDDNDDDTTGLGGGAGW